MKSSFERLLNQVSRRSVEARGLKNETYALYLAVRDLRLPWYARLLALCVVGYAFSPIDLRLTFIPLLRYLDDLVLVPLGNCSSIENGSRRADDRVSR
jgi:uncharacterized membrane protein YkvA (DUF1232 family)